MAQPRLRIMHFGHFGLDYPRNRALADAASRHGDELLTCRSDATSMRGRYAELWRRASAIDCDVVVVGFIGHTDVPLAWLVAKRKRVPLVFDAFYSLYGEFLSERPFPVSTWRQRLLNRRKLLALWLIDEAAFRLPDVVLLDTHAHVDYVRLLLHLSLRKNNLHAWAVGAEEDRLGPHLEDQRLPSADRPLRVLFFGHLNPLQGLETIVRAASLVERESMDFTLIGPFWAPQHARLLEILQGMANITLLPPMAKGILSKYVNEADVVLGIFGDSPKARVVVPNKVYDALACGRPVITADSPGVREILRDEPGLLLVPPADPEQLALRLKEFSHLDDEERANLGAQAADLYKRRYTRQRLAQDFYDILATTGLQRSTPGDQPAHLPGV